MAKSKLISAVQAIIKPANIGDTARYIEDGSGVAHPVEDVQAREDISTLQAEVDKMTVDAELSDKSEKPVQNKVINKALGSKADTGHKHSIDDVEELSGTLADKADKIHSHDSATTDKAGFMVPEDKIKLNELFNARDNVVYVKASDTPTEFTQYAEKSNYIIYDDLASALAANSNAEFAEVVILPGTHDIGYINIVENSKKFKNLILRGFSPLYASECILQTTHSQSTMALRINSDNIAIYDLNMQFDKHIYGFDTIAKNVVFKNIILKTGGSYLALQIQRAANVEVSNCCFDVKNGSTGLTFACIDIGATNSLKLYGNTCIALYDYRCSEPTYSIIYGNTNLEKRI